MASGMPSASASAQMRGVEIGDADRADQPLFLQPRHLVQRVEPGRMLEASTSGTAGGRPCRRRAGRAAPARPARTISAVIGPGSGHHLVKATGRFRRRRSAPAAGRRSARRCRSGRPCRTCRSRPRHRRRARRRRVRDRAACPSFSMSATCHRPQISRLIGQAVAERGAVRDLRHRWSSRWLHRARAGRGSLPRWRDTTRSSPRMPRGRRSRIAQSATPIMTICSDAARACWPAGNSAATSAGRAGPDAPDQHRAEDGAAIVAGAADDQHRPDLEGEHRHVIVRAR